MKIKEPVKNEDKEPVKNEDKGSDKNEGKEPVKKEDKGLDKNEGKELGTIHVHDNNQSVVNIQVNIIQHGDSNNPS